MEEIKKRQGVRIVAALLLILICALSLAVPVCAAGRAAGEEYVYVGGMPFGVRYVTDGIMVVGYCDVTTGNGVRNPAKEAFQMRPRCNAWAFWILPCTFQRTSYRATPFS